jgi:hypothetical protein
MASAHCDIRWQHMLLRNQTQRRQLTASSDHSAGPAGMPAAAEAASQMPPLAGPTCAMVAWMVVSSPFSFTTLCGLHSCVLTCYQLSKVLITSNWRLPASAQQAARARPEAAVADAGHTQVAPQSLDVHPPHPPCWRSQTLTMIACCCVPVLRQRAGEWVLIQSSQALP